MNKTYPKQADMKKRPLKLMIRPTVFRKWLFTTGENSTEQVAQHKAEMVNVVMSRHFRSNFVMTFEVENFNSIVDLSKIHTHFNVQTFPNAIAKYPTHSTSALIALLM